MNHAEIYVDFYGDAYEHVMMESGPSDVWNEFPIKEPSMKDFNIPLIPFKSWDIIYVHYYYYYLTTDPDQYPP